MSFLKKAAAFLTAAAMTAALASCADTSYVVTADGDNINAGVYIDYMFNTMQNQIYIWQYSGVTENFFDQTVDGKNFADYLSDTALDSTKRFAAVEKLFKDAGLKVSSEDMKAINNSINDSWESLSKLYEKEGISKDSLKKVSVNAKKEEMLFDYYYGTGGTEAVSKETLQQYMNDNYLRYKAITINKSTAEDDAAKQSENEEKKALFEKYKGLAEGVKFDEFDEIIHQYEEETAVTDDAEGTDDVGGGEGDDSSAADESSVDESSSDESSSAADSSEADDSSSEADDSSGDSESSSQLESFEAADEASSDDVIEIDDSAIDISDVETTGATDPDDADGAEEAEDPYEHERLMNYSTLSEETLEQDYGKMYTEIKNGEVDSIITYESESAYYIISKGEVSGRTDYLDNETNFDTVLHEAKDKDFDAKIDACKETIKFSLNQEAVDRYAPKNIYDRYQDYQEKNNSSANQQ